MTLINEDAWMTGRKHRENANKTIPAGEK